MYLGLTAFPISTRNSAIAVAHLVSKIGVRQMYVSADPAMQRLAQEANELLLAKDGIEFEALPMPNFEDLYGPGGDDALVPMGKVTRIRRASSSILLVSLGPRRDGGALPVLTDAIMVAHTYAQCRLHRVSEANQVLGQELQEVGHVCM